MTSTEQALIRLKVLINVLEPGGTRREIREIVELLEDENTTAPVEDVDDIVKTAKASTSFGG
ncbi:hypothetical protein [Listeria booriae]|uniref:Uncharacterized protein n=1 Tax=Listeria booriae TaxID=1552123 RepID=A0A842EX46_9LIST|nr:hypothetical protein [Listeria booriae]MBC1231499.1 hypothetical protein [Listeria booriae]MBC2239765.1 hypothetical protein [Listeria booriae]